MAFKEKSQTLQNSKNKLLMGNNKFTVLKAKLKVSISHLCFKLPFWSKITNLSHKEIKLNRKAQ